MIDNILTHLDSWLDRQPKHLVMLASGFSFIVGLWVIGHQVGVL